ncbi:MAG: hypothetical protein DRI48_06560 [Chloroflexi bacterium]|nr:MAG: hypothetical protein DRI48_06560 [Chloroflexota bacterium]
MTKLLDEIRYDLSYLKSHTLQPPWFKIAKVLILLVFLVGYTYLFGWIKTLVFFAVFFLLSTVVHLVYRSNTNRWTQSWLDFVVVEENGKTKTKHIGKFYYLAVILNVIISLVISQVLPGVW